MNPSATNRWCRAFVAVGIGFFVAAQAAVVAGAGRRTVVVLGLYGFVFHVIFGKTYALVPAYFDRHLATSRAIAIHLPLAVVGTIGLTIDSIGVVPTAIGDVAAVGFALGCVLFVGTLVWTVRNNLTGAETGTGEAKQHLQRIDRLANAFVPLVLAYVLIGSVLLVLGRPFGGSLPGGFGRYQAVTHLFAAGGGTLLVLAVGFRLLPRFLVVAPRPPLVAVALLSGAIGPAVLVGNFLGNALFRLGATLQALAIVTFAIAYFDMYRRSGRDRVGLYAVALGSMFGVATALLGLHFAFVGVEPATIDVHYRFALTGFLGLTIVGVSYVFYPPAIGPLPVDGTRFALWSVGLLGVGLVVEGGGALGGISPLETSGSVLTLVGAAIYATVVWSVFLARR